MYYKNEGCFAGKSGQDSGCFKGIKGASKPLHYLIYDVTGKPLIRGKSNDDYFSVNVEALVPGMYILKLFNAYHIPLSTKKIIIK